MHGNPDETMARGHLLPLILSLFMHSGVAISAHILQIKAFPLLSTRPMNIKQHPGYMMCIFEINQTSNYIENIYDKF